MSTFKKGNRVIATSPKTGRQVEGKIVSVIETERGLWYEVKTEEGYLVRFRAANLELA